MSKTMRTLILIAQTAAYLIAGIILFQIIKYLLGGIWPIEEIILAFTIFNLTAIFGLLGYIININSNLSKRMSSVDKNLHGHMEWHRGNDNRKI
ncbi:MAG TPA: hypothetical protein VJG30_00810 [Candidatus Nanoarchaeia archaeon]|nr:hypothetical protein [Candidatus Nanoarchaeia archaeon]